MTASAFRFCDDLGPKTILHLYEPAIGLKAIAVVDNTAAGPAIGGVRMAPDVSCLLYTSDAADDLQPV